MTLQSDWHWHRFLSNALDGNLDSAAAEVVRRSGTPVSLLVELYGVNSIPKPGVQEKADESARFELKSAAAGYELVSSGHDMLRCDLSRQHQ